jgi:hypothetical protein
MTEAHTLPLEQLRQALEVTQADREAAARYERLTCPAVADVIVSGAADGMQLVQAFARHRISALAALEQPTPPETRLSGALPKSIGRLHLGERCADGDRMCHHSHYVEAGHPLYWPQMMGQYDDSDPYCLEHAIELAESDSSWCEHCVNAVLTEQQKGPANSASKGENA